MTHVRSIGAAAVLFALAGCHETTRPAPQADSVLTGNWLNAPVTPSGFFTLLTLRAAGGRITGQGEEHVLCCTSHPLTVSGEYTDSTHAFSLSIRISTGSSATYAGRAMGMDSLTGTWTSSSPAESYPVTMLRIAVDPPASGAAGTRAAPGRAGGAP